MNSKTFLSISEQIDRLKSFGIKIQNSDATIKKLSKNSYYNIINGYREPFLYLDQKNKYQKGTSFDEIYSLYDFDRKIRNAIFPYLLDIENSLKSEILYEFANARDDDNVLLHDTDAYLKLSSYEATITNQRNQVKQTTELISGLHNIISKSFDKSETFNHHLTKYGYIPLWVLGTQLTFGNISKFYSCMKSKNRQNISKKYHMSDKEFNNILKLLTVARNHCAHYNRLYCLKYNVTLTQPNEKYYPIQHKFISSQHSNSDLFSVLIAMKFVAPKKNYTSLINIISSHMKELTGKLNTISINTIMETMGFPNNWLDLKK